MFSVSSWKRQWSVYDPVSENVTANDLPDTDHAVRGYRELPPGVPSPGDGVLRTRMKYIVERRDASWSTTAAQNTAVITRRG